MNIIPIDPRTLNDPEFIHADPADQATWLLLVQTMHQHDLPGVLPNAKTWKRICWNMIAHLEPERVFKDSPLWSFSGPDLILHLIPESWRTPHDDDPTFRSRNARFAIALKTSRAAG